MDTLLSIDHQLLELINKSWTHPVLDSFFIFWTDFQKHPFFTYGLLPLFILTLVWKKKWKVFLIILVAVLGTFLADSINANWIKPIFERERPTDVILRIARQGSHSFPSSHAVDAFFIAAFFRYYYPRLRPFLFALCSLTAYSRIYCGVHYPSDVLAGALVGVCLAWVFYKLVIVISRKVIN